MKAYEAVKEAANNKGIPLTRVSTGMGRPSNYIHTGMARGSTPKADTLAAMLDVCGYALAAVPLEDVPPTALRIDPPKDEGSGTADNTAEG